MKGIHRRAPKRGPIVARRGIALGLVLALFTAGIALADNVQNNVSSSSSGVTNTIGTSVGVGYRISATGGDGQNGCNASDGSDAVVTIVAPASVAVSPASLRFTSCGDFLTAQFAGSVVGVFDISVSVSDTGPGSYGTDQATFRLNVVAPADSTPPVIVPNIAGTLGASGWYTTDVAVTWSVTDEQSSVSSMAGCGSSAVNSDTAESTFTCSATSAGGTATQSVTIRRDATAPTISGLATPAAVNGWNTGDVTVSFTCVDGLSGVASCGTDTTLTADGAAQSVTGTAVDNAGNSASATVSGINIDKTAPIISGEATTLPNGSGWYNGDVRVEFTCSDALSGLASCGPNENLVGDGAGQSVSGTAVDNAGNLASATVSGINIDKTAPTLSPTVLPNTILLGAVGVVSAGASDELSGIASVSCDALDTSSVGVKFVWCTATDKAGNTATTSVSYSVIYDFAGFFRPVDNLPVVNVVKAGSAIPIKFSLRGNQGLDIFMLGYPRSGPVPCPNAASPDSIEETVTAGNSSLSYDAAADQYNYVWKTGKTWTGCRLFEVKFADGTTQTAMFKFTK